MKARRVAWSIWGLTLVLLAVWPFLGAAANSLGDEWVFYLVVPIAILAYATVGVLITSRHPENRIGLILVGVALAFAVALTAGDYATAAVRRPDLFPFARWIAWFGRVAFALWLAPIPLLFLLYPNGKLASRRWRPVLWVLLAALSINVTLLAVTPGPLETGFAELGGKLSNPLGLPISWRTLVQNATELAGLIAFGCAVLSIVSLVLRFRRSSGIERQQIRWLGYVGAMLVAVPLLGLLLALVRTLFGVDVDAEGDVVGTAAWITFFVVLLFGIPSACAIAILRYRLYELDVVVKKTVQYGVLVVGFTAVIGLVVVLAPAMVLGVGADVGGMFPIVLGVLLAIGFTLVRSRAQRLANRIVYGKRSTPYEVLSEFAERVGGTYSTEDVLPRMAQLLGEATGARAARVWLRLGDRMRAEATWPMDAPATGDVVVQDGERADFGEDVAFHVRHQADLLGALTVSVSPADPMNPTKEKLVRDMASQAGLVLRNVRLIEDLRESRRRIVGAQDERAKKLERDIHDGAQQQLVALSVKLRLASGMVDRDPAKARDVLEDLQEQTTETLEDLRDLARGIYPPLLADQGLPAALAAQARKSPVPVTIESDGVVRYRQDVESAIYFSCLEALNNVAKYSEASSVKIRLLHRNGLLSFEVADDGRGFDPSSTARGTGLQGIEDRLDAIGGRLDVVSSPGNGTTVAGSIPAAVGARA